MKSIYRQVLGSDFNKLHPQIQKRFGFNSNDKIASIGKGVMQSVWYGKPYTLPFLYMGTWRNIMFPQKGKEIPFTIENYAYKDKFGRETITWVRKYQFPKRVRRFDATMIYSEQRNRIVDYLGTHQHLAVDIEMTVAENGGIKLRSGEQRFYEGFLGFKFPMLFSGEANVCEWYDDKEQKFKISVVVSNKTWGKLFGYEGTFDTEYIIVNSKADIPKDVMPVREEIRE
ncbi:DUF4166 domain-containing protein [Belliella kenyensis]|uniref:DUF4166 domain-containing protein n=1 Tax=Belliella kenyensis TaxID=1472724 RepID=A0ABV8EKQ1_9BACT|nr:DUF4166 domain-containing protein [Belliella kenyensis]MCH7403506.1 DUF4166 domain-containing protein [Belliella kenyensis]MDN3604972.1 DUF4166 domain-containing protein [Belliella kenyensis]